MRERDDVASHPNDPLLSTREVAEYLRCTEGSLRNLRVRGDGPRYIKLGSKVFYRQSTIEAYLRAHERQSTAEKNLDSPRSGR